MMFIEAPQGSPAWYQARVGKITASCFADAVSVMQKNSATRKVGEPTAAAERYAADLAIERISALPHGEPIKTWVLERGHEMEAKARMIYEARTGAFVTEAGICVSDDGIFGYSTDGLVDDDGLIEIKAPIDSIKIMEMWRTGDVSEYEHQMQGGMWITGRKYTDFIMYVPDLAVVGKDLFVKRIFRDDAFIDTLAQQLADFDSLVLEYETILRDGAPVLVPLISEVPMNTMKEVVTMLENEYKDPDFDEVQPAPAAQTTPQNIPEIIPEPAQNPAPSSAPSLRLGQIGERLGFTVTADFMLSLGFAPAATEKAAKLYHEADFKNICAALIRHISAVSAK